MTQKSIPINLAPGEVSLGELRDIYTRHAPFNLEHGACLLYTSPSPRDS